MTKTKLIHWVSLKVFNENFLPFICPRPLVLGDTNPIPSPFTPGMPLSPSLYQELENYRYNFYTALSDKWNREKGEVDKIWK